MLPKGLFGIVSSASFDCTEARASLCALLDEDEYYEHRCNAAGNGIMGVICSNRYPYVKNVSATDDESTIGAIDGHSFHGSRLDAQPHRLLDTDLRLPEEANGMFAAAAWNGRALRLLVDPFASTPLYYRWNDRFFAFSSSLAALASIDAFPAMSYSEHGLAQYWCWGKILNGQTISDDVYKMQAAEILDFSFVDHALDRKKYWKPDIAPEQSASAVSCTVDAFTASVDSVMDVLPEPVCVSLSGGYDSRTILAVLLSLNKQCVYVTHGMLNGYDMRIARSIAKAYRLDHRLVWIDESFSEKYHQYAEECVLRSNGMISLENAHLPFVYMSHASYAHSIIDGITTFLERSFGPRRKAASVRSRDELFEVVWNYLASGREAKLRTLEYVWRYIDIAKEQLYNILPDPRDASSPGACVDAFYLEHIIANHVTDAVGLQQHYNRFMTPYYDLDYVTEVARVPEKQRSRNIPQRAIMRRHCPSLRWISRSYSDIRTPPVPSYAMQLVPVAMDRILHGIAPPPIRRLWHRPTLDYAQYVDANIRISKEIASGSGPLLSGVALPPAELAIAADPGMLRSLLPVFIFKRCLDELPSIRVRPVHS